VFIAVCRHRREVPDACNHGSGTLLREFAGLLSDELGKPDQVVRGLEKMNSQFTFSSPRSFTWRSGPVCFSPQSPFQSANGG